MFRTLAAAIRERRPADDGRQDAWEDQIGAQRLHREKRALELLLGTAQT